MDISLIIKGCQKGERTAQRLLFDKFYRYVYTISLKYVRNHHDCQDVVSEVFDRVFKNIHQVESPSNKGVHKWIKTIAINESLRLIKRRSPLLFLEEEVLLSQDQRVGEAEEREPRYSTQQLMSVINDMPNGYRQIFLLKVVDGLTHEEICHHLDISRNTSKSQLLKARKYISTELIKITSNEF